MKSTFRSMMAGIALLTWTSITHAQDLEEISVQSSLDQSLQPSLVFVPDADDQPIPLLVLLHSWSGDYRQKGNIETCLKECTARGWALLHPNFRGPNWTPQACGSDLAVQDIIDAIDWVAARHNIDSNRVYLTGVSGGGHMSMLMAGRHPKRWAAVSAWVGISDLSAWHQQTKMAGRNYFQHMEKVTGGEPGTSDDVDRQYSYRSPLDWLENAAGVSIDLNAGIHDGHTGSVPISHSLRAFNRLTEVNGDSESKLRNSEIRAMTETETVPANLQFSGPPEEREHDILFRREAGPVRVTIFEGGHEGDMPTAIRWLAQHSR